MRARIHNHPTSRTPHPRTDETNNSPPTAARFGALRYRICCDEGEARRGCSVPRGRERSRGRPGAAHALRGGHPFSRGMGPRSASCCDCPAVEQSCSLAPTCPSRSAWHNPPRSQPPPPSRSRSLCEPRTPTPSHRPQPATFFCAGVISQ